MPAPQFDIDNPTITSFLAGCQRVVNDYLKRCGYSWEEPLSLEQGPRYIRVIKTTQGNQRSAFCFVDRATGDILKTAGWKTPAKGPRGNLFDSHKGLKAMTPFGAVYLR